MRLALRSALTILAAVLFALLALGSGHAAFGQNSGALIPWVPMTFPNALGTGPNVLGFVCSYAAGTTTPLLTYQNAALSVANQNPIRLNAAGHAVSGSTEVSIYLTPASYKFNLYTAGIGNTCNGTAVGALIRSVDNVYDLAQFFSTSFATKVDDTVRHCSQFPGADMGAKMAAAIADVPTQGVVDCTGLVGAQSAGATITIAKPIKLILGATTLTLTGNPGLQITGAGLGTEIVGNGGTTILKTSATSANVLMSVYISSFVKIHGLYFQGGGDSDPVNPSVALDLDQVTDTEVYGNNFKDFNIGTRSILDPATGSVTPTKIDIHDNIYQNGYGDSNGGYGVLMVRGSAISAHDNIFSPGPFGRHGLYLSAGSVGCKISNNIVKNSRLAPIAVNSGTNLPADLMLGNSITGNVLYGPGTYTLFSYGINVTGGWQDGQISNNNIFNAGDVGILMQAASAATLIKDSSITGNIIKGSQGAGILCFDCYHINISDNSVINSNASNGMGMGTDGIRIDNGNSPASTDNLISGNVIYGILTRYGIFLNSNASSNFVTANDLRGNVTGGILDSGSGNWLAANQTGAAAGETYTGPLRFEVGNATGFRVTNTGQQYTEVDLANADTVKTSWYWDNTTACVGGGAGTCSVFTTGPFKFQTNGVVVGSPTGGDKGTGTANFAAELYANGTIGSTATLSCGGGQAVKTITVVGGIVTAVTCGAP